MSILRRAILALALIAGFSPAFAQAPGPVPALPDTERRQAYSLTASTCACNVNFAIFGDGTDYGNWIEVWVNGINVPQFGNWSLSSPSGSIGTLPRPITNAVLTFNAAQTGTVQIVGARRPRRISQFSESGGVSARNLNQTFTDVIAMLRETWDKTNDVTGRAIMAPPGETLNILAAATLRANQVLGFDATGNIGLYSPASAVTTSANVNFLQAGTGAISRTVQAELRDTIKAQQFGEVCDGVTDDAPAVQRALTFADSIGSPTVQLCAGFTRWNSTPFLNKWALSGILTAPGISIKGAGKGATTIDNRTSGFAIASNPDWKATHQSQSTLAPQTVGGTLGASSPIGTLGAITGGTLYTNGTYSGVALTGGAGTGATANITVAGGSVTVVTLVSAGTGYAIGNVLSATAASIGGTGSGFSIPVATETFYVQITMNTPQGDEIFVTLGKPVVVTTATSSITITLSPLNSGYSYNLYCGTAAIPVNYCTVSGGNATALGGGQSVLITTFGTAHAVPTNKLAVWQQVNISDLSITSTTNVTGASGISLFKSGYSTIERVYVHHMNGTGFELTDYTGDLDGSFNIHISNSKFDTIAGNCVYAAGLALEMSNFTVDNGTIFNICGTLTPNTGPTFPFTILSINNSATPTVTTTLTNTIQKNDQVRISGVLGMALPADSYRACGTITTTSFQLCDLYGASVNTVALGAYTASSGSEYLEWRPPSPTNGVTGCMIWMGLIGTLHNSNFTQCNNFALYAPETGSSDNLSIEGVDFENTAGKAVYIAAAIGGSMRDSECLSATALGATISCVQLGAGSNAGGVQNFQIDRVKVRSDVVPSTAFEHFPNTGLTGTFADTVRVRNVTWQQFDVTSGLGTQKRFNGFTFDPIPGQVQFLISAVNTAKLAPTGYGGTLPLQLKVNGEWVAVKIPNAGITLATGTLAPNTTYNFLAYNSAVTASPIAVALEAVTTGVVLDPAGYYVKSGDSSRAFVGQARTDGAGNFQTNGLQVSQYPLQLSLPLAWAGGAIGCPTCVLISGTGRGDSNYSILATDRYVYTNANFTVPRVWTLPPANSLTGGTTIWVGDAQNTVTSTNTLTVQRAGADTINTSSTSLLITGQAGGITFTTDGVSNWGVPVQTVSTGGTGRQTLTNHGVLVGAAANPVTQLAVGTNGQFLAGATGADPAFVTASQDCTLSAAGAFTCTKTNNVSFAAIATSASATDLTTGTLPAARLGGMSNITNSLGANVALNNTANYFDGPSIAQGTTGTWFASGTVTVLDTASGSANVICKLWDGTTVISSGSVSAAAVGQNATIALSGVLASPAANIRISCRDTTATTGLISFNASGNSKDSTITGFRIQ